MARAQQQPSAGAGAARDKSPLRGAGGGGGRPRTPSRDLQPVSGRRPAAERSRHRDEDRSQRPRPRAPRLRADAQAAREHGGPSRGGAPDYGNGGGGGADEEDELVKQRDDLMDTILEEEEQLINAHRVQVLFRWLRAVVLASSRPPPRACMRATWIHRRGPPCVLALGARAQIEETMDAVRKEMALLTEVDQPGSAIDVYVERLDELLQGKLALIQGLRHKLDRFKEHLKLEESLSKSIPPGSHVKKYYS